MHENQKVTLSLKRNKVTLDININVALFPKGDKKNFGYRYQSHSSYQTI